jgi:prepilin-type processing-associated H-X9-DG protein
VAQLKAEGCSNREIARRLGCSEKAVRKRLRRLGYEPARTVQVELPLGTPPSQGADPNVSGPAAAPVEKADHGSGSADPNLSGSESTKAAEAPPAEELPFTLDDDPADRRWDRLFAYLGLLDDAAPLFRDGQAVPRAGVLLAIPVLLGTGVLDAARQVWGSIGPAFYGLRTSIVAMLLMALLRIKRPEALKEHSPPELGRILGLDRAPEVKTLRRKLSRLAASGGAELFGRLLAQRRVSTHGHTLGFLYVDGHVRIYYGRRRIPKTHAARIHAVVSAAA